MTDFWIIQCKDEKPSYRTISSICRSLSNHRVAVHYLISSNLSSFTIFLYCRNFSKFSRLHIFNKSSINQLSVAECYKVKASGVFQTSLSEDSSKLIRF